MTTKRKVLVIVLALCMALWMCVLTGCGNENWGFGNYTYEHAYVGLGTEGRCVDVSSWHNNEVGIELHLDDSNSIYCSEGTYILFKDANHCPFCHGGK